MKAKELIEVSVETEDGFFKTLLPVPKLRKLISIGKDVTVKLYSNGKHIYNMSFTLQELQYMVNKYDLLHYSIIPRSLRNYIQDFTSIIAETEVFSITGRDEELNKAWFYLSHDVKNNVFLVGDVDSGKTIIAQELIRQIVSFECPKKFYGKRAISFNFNVLLEIKQNFVYERVIERIMSFLEKTRKTLLFMLMMHSI